ncbi:Arginine/ornithine antiporter ArcD [hydrothermal vent metagenome]|uniref:Arginine/ornithine antiporter ArcD n=1 Tax=hydrothermal vent metagenome TaxID=652676 RepID=A0A1W1EDN2_9ZZZZ
MRLGLYIFASLTFMALVGAFTYTINSSYYVVEIMGININFPVAVWVVLPMLILLVFTVIHMVFYSLKSYFKLKKWQKDADTLDDALYWSMVQEPKEQKYTIGKIASSANILGQSKIEVLDNVEGLSPRLSKVLNVVNKIKNGDYVDLKDNKMSKVFTEGNPLLIKNRLNHLDHDPKFIEEVMKSPVSFSDPVRKKALAMFAQKESFFKARKYAKVFDLNNFFVMMQRLNTEEDMELTTDILDDFVAALNFNCNEFVRTAYITKKQFSPDENLALFKKYQSEYPKAQLSYLYLLFEYELMDEVGLYLDEQHENDFVRARALYSLKKANKNYKIEDLMNINTICL